MASANKSLGKFDLMGIPPARRGVPQIEVTFDIDANGILHVSAKDKATGKEQSIRITASSGLSEEEIQNMVKDAEMHAAEDKKFHELITARNQADNMIHSVEKMLEEMGDKIDASEKSNIETAVKSLKDVLQSDDKEAIENKTKALTEVSSKLAEKMYSQAGGAAGVDPTAGFTDAAQAAQNAHASGGKKKDDVVDAEFEEIKEKK